MQLTNIRIATRFNQSASVASSNSRAVSRKNAFTLIELLVVMAIIALLAAILFPVFSRARENARRSSCQSNLKQIGLGMLQYSQDYDERLPFFYYGPNGDATDPSSVAAARYKWMDAVYPYIKSEQVFTCPSDVSSNTYRYIYYQNLTAPSNANYGSYGMNIMYRYDPSPGLRQPPAGSDQSGLSLAALQDPSGTVWVGDIVSAPLAVGFGWQCLTGSGCGPQPATIVDATLKPNQIDRLVARHLETTNMLYTDGHVKAQKLDSLAARRAPDGVTLSAFTIQNDG